MLQTILQYRLDLIAFFVITLAAAFTINERLLSGRVRLRTRAAWWFGLSAVVVGGVVIALYAEDRQRAQLRATIAGMAPTYAHELSTHGHNAITLATTENDPEYLALIELEKEWLRINPHVHDIFTLRRLAADQVVALVDSETDYNRNGRYDDAREARTPLGEESTRMSPQLWEAFQGNSSFDDVPRTDRWGTWVSAYAPLYDPQGKLDGIVGVDFDGSAWTSSLLWARCSTLGFVTILTGTVLGATCLTAWLSADLQQRKVQTATLQAAN